MAYQWFRLYHRIIDDDKIRLLAFEDRWHFVALLCLKGEGLIDEPDSDLRVRKLAVKLGLQVREVEEVFRRLSEVGLTDERGDPIAWQELQFQSDSSTERVRKYRERKKKRGGNEDETLQKRRGNDPVTPQDTDTETDTEENTMSTPGGDDAAPAGERIPYKAIVDAYHELLPDLPKVKMLSAKRKAHMRQRHLSIMERSIEIWRQYFEYVGKSDFLMGRVDDSTWRAHFDFLISERGTVGVYEGKYHGQR